MYERFWVTWYWARLVASTRTWVTASSESEWQSLRPAFRLARIRALLRWDSTTWQSL